MVRLTQQMSALRDERWAMMEERTDLEHHLSDAKAEAKQLQVLIFSATTVCEKHCRLFVSIVSYGPRGAMGQRNLKRLHPSHCHQFAYRGSQATVCRASKTFDSGV